MIEWLETELNKLKGEVEIITPKKQEERGCQLSIFIKGSRGKRIFDFLDANNVIADLFSLISFLLKVKDEEDDP